MVAPFQFTRGILDSNSYPIGPLNEPITGVDDMDVTSRYLMLWLAEANTPARAAAIAATDELSAVMMIFRLLVVSHFVLYTQHEAHGRSARADL